jgi:hypothetical protein
VIVPSPPIYQLRPSGPPAIRCCNSDQADFILGDSPEPPPDSAAWQRQPLPDNWLVSSRLLSSSSALIASRTMPFKRSQLVASEFYEVSFHSELPFNHEAR